MDLSIAIHSEPYYIDGNLVLAAKAREGPPQLFKTYRGILAQYSPIFKDMLSVASAPDSRIHDQYDGVPLVETTDDAEDWKELLRMVHSAPTITISHLDPQAPLALEGPLKLAIKYEMEVLRTCIIKHLEAAWPPTFEDFLTHRAEIRRIQIACAKNDDRMINGKKFHEQIPEPTAVICIARRYNVSQVLPAAYYDLFTTYSKFESWCALFHPSEDQESLKSQYTGRIVQEDLMDSLDLKRLISLQVFIHSFMEHTVLNHLHVIDPCYMNDGCAKVFDEVIDLVTGVRHEVYFGPDIVTWYERVTKKRKSLCHRCQKELTKVLKVFSDGLWGRLASFT